MTRHEALERLADAAERLARDCRGLEDIREDWAAYQASLDDVEQALSALSSAGPVRVRDVCEGAAGTTVKYRGYDAPVALNLCVAAVLEHLGIPIEEEAKK